MTEKKQIIHLGWGNMVSIFLAILLLSIAILLWKENSFSTPVGNSKSALPSGFPTIPLHPNQNFN